MEAVFQLHEKLHEAEGVQNPLLKQLGAGLNLALVRAADIGQNFNNGVKVRISPLVK